MPFRFLRLATVLAVGLTLALPFCSFAQSVLYYSDGEANPSGNMTPKALADLGISPTTASDEADFVTQLSSGTWDLVILYPQLDTLAAAESALATWVSGGGKAIAGSISLDNTFAEAFDAEYVGALNVDQDEIASAGSPLWSGVTSPLALTNPGWGTYSAELNALDGGVVAGTYSATGTASIVVGNDGYSILNGFLDDTYDAATEADRLTLAKNQIQSVLSAGTISVPETGTGVLTLLGMMASGIVIVRRKRGT